jgi:ribosome-associated protein YbcJ (S4-like RNA binding protein)
MIKKGDIITYTAWSDTKLVESLTLGKQYEVLGVSINGSPLVENDKGEITGYPIKIFIEKQLTAQAFVYINDAIDFVNTKKIRQEDLVNITSGTYFTVIYWENKAM